MRLDRYRNYAELSENESLGIDFSVAVLPRESSTIAIIAPHGGKIELYTSEVARQIAGEDFNLYLFEGIKPKGNYAALHLTSHHFDEPSCLSLLSVCDTVVAVHGCTCAVECVMLGGLDTPLKDSLSVALQEGGIRVETENHDFLAIDTQNICNRGRTQMGVQIELTRALRESSNKVRVVNAVRDILLTLQQE